MDQQLRYRAVVFDLDGTLYLDGIAIEGAAEAVAGVRARGLATLFVSNNPLRTPQEYADRLRVIGIEASSGEVFTSAIVIADWIVGHRPSAEVFVIGEPAFHDQLGAAGITTTRTWRDADSVLASFDRTFSYDRWRDACFALRAGAYFMATNPDVTCPTAEGQIPDCGGIVAALEASSGRTVDLVAGKPSAVMADRIAHHVGLPREEVLVVGDRVATDVAMARQAGFGSALVLSGVTTRAQATRAAWVPDHILDSVADLPSVLDGEPISLA